MNTITLNETTDESAPRAIIHSWRLMINLLAGVPCPLPGDSQLQHRTARTHRFDAPHDEKDGAGQ